MSLFNIDTSKVGGKNDNNNINISHGAFITKQAVKYFNAGVMTGAQLLKHRN